MRIDFRHGLYRAEIDSITRQPIVAIVDGSSLVTRVTNSPVVWTLAQFDKNYTLAEYKTRVIATLSDLNQAAETWVYVQINPTTGVHSFGVTPYLPTYGPEAPVGVDGQLWFNTVDKVTKRYESVSRTWRRTMCLVIGRWDGRTFHSIDFGSAVGLNATDCETGTIVRNAVNRGISDGLHGFLTTADHLFTDSDNTHDFKLESNITRATAVEPIPAFHVVTYTEFGQVRLANYEDTSDAVIALSTSSAATGDPVELLLQGKAYNQGLWNWPEVNAALWVGESGKLVDEDPRDPQDSRPSKVPIARVIGKDTILFEQGMGGKGERGERGIQIPATDQYLGIVKMSVPADDYEQPVAVGINDPILWDHRHPASVIDVAPFEGSLYYSDAQSSIELLARTKLNLSGGNLTGAVSSDVGAATANELPTYRQVKDWVEQEIEPLTTYEYVDGQLNERLEDRPTFTQMGGAIQSEAIVRPTFDQLDVILEDYYTELQAGELIATKVDKVVGKELSTNDLTDPLFNKLVSLESSHYRGLFTSLAKLIAGVANPVSGDYADVDTAGSPILRYIWDVTDSVWEPQQGDTPPLTPEQVKQLYEANDNTNAFTDGLLGKLQNIQALATKNQTDAFLLDRTNHTGHQAIGTIANLQQTLDALEVEVDKSVRSVDGRIGDVVLTDLYTPFIKHNINATTPPTATDSEEEGYSILSVWITNDGGIWICTSATIPAIWNPVAAVDLGSAAYLNIGTSPQNIPTNEILTSELGQAAWLDVGTNNDQVPTMLNVKTITENLDFIKVDKVEGMGLSANDFTIQLKEKLEALEGTHFRGTFISPTQLVQYAIDPVAGDYANVDGGHGSQVVQYIYDADDLLWVPQQAAVPPITASQVKQLYESNPNTNVYDDAAKAVVDGVTAKFDKADIAQATGTATDKVMSQKAVTDALGNKVDKELGYSLLSDTEIARLVTMETAATKNRADIENADKVHTHTTAQVTGLDAALTGKASTTDPRFTDAREWTATTLPQAEAEAGVATTRRAFTAQRVRQAIVAWFNGISGALGRTILTRTTAAQVRADIGLGAVDNTSDTDKPVSTAVADGLSLKVDKVTGKGLSDANFTQAEKDKLSSLENSKFVGLFVSESTLPLSGSEGDYANVDGGVGSDAYQVIWDSSDNKWVKMQGVSTDLTPAQIKQQYENNPDTNAFTDDEKAKLASVANGATANRDDSENADKEHTHTIASVEGLQLALDDLESDVSTLSTDKVDKDDAKQLSDENYTLNEKTKLANVGDPLRDFVTDYLISRG